MPTPIQPAYIEEALQTIEKLRTDHYDRASPSQRFINWLTAHLARPRFLALITITVLVWIFGNLIAERIGLSPWDAPPFQWLQVTASIGALYITGLILTAQRHDDVLAGHREQLTLELAMLAEQKSAKIIQLLEELRRDDPLVKNRVDHEAAAMSKPTDPNAVIDAIKSDRMDVSGP